MKFLWIIIFLHTPLWSQDTYPLIGDLSTVDEVKSQEDWDKADRDSLRRPPPSLAEKVNSKLATLGFVGKRLMIAIKDPRLRRGLINRPFLPELPFNKGISPIGMNNFNYKIAQDLTKASPRGVTTFWAGPIPVLYITDAEIRQKLITQESTGPIDEKGTKELGSLFNQNNVKKSFTDFRNKNSKAYQVQRKFLMDRLFNRYHQYLQKIQDLSREFFQTSCREKSSLRDSVTTLIMRISSDILGFQDRPLDCIHDENPTYKMAFEKAAQYGVSQPFRYQIEEDLYDFFYTALKENFNSISNQSAKENIVKALHESLSEDEFPKSMEEFDRLPRQFRYDLAHTFISIGLGAMAHSTTNSLDWVLASLFSNEDKLRELTKIVQDNKDKDLTDLANYDKEGGVFYPLARFMMYTLFKHPPFTHKYERVNRDKKVVLPLRSPEEAKEVTVPENAIMIVNFRACNDSLAGSESENAFCKRLKKKNTLLRFVDDNTHATFGGSNIFSNKKSGESNKHSRKCPGRRISIVELAIITATLLRDFPDLQVGDDIDCSEKTTFFPLCTRVNKGNFQTSR